MQAVAKYLLAEMPARDQIPASLGFDPVEVARDAGIADGEINRVGALFNLMESLAGSLSESDIHDDSVPFQADPDKWRAPRFNLVLQKVTAINGQEGLVKLIRAIGEQGEGPAAPPAGESSHFLRFFDLYKAAKQQLADSGGAPLANAVPVDPTVLDPAASGYLQQANANQWGDVLNHRFRWLFISLGHYLSTEVADERNALVRWCFDEMRTIREIAEVLSELPQHDPIPELLT